MLSSSAQIVGDGFAIVMDRSLEPKTVAELTALLGAVPRIDSFHDFKTRVGRVPHVDFHVVVDPQMSAQEVHDLFLDLRTRICAITGESTKVLMHADPRPGPKPEASPLSERESAV
jgi:ferrous-iron efflux pump FieF